MFKCFFSHDWEINNKTSSKRIIKTRNCKRCHKQQELLVRYDAEGRYFIWTNVKQISLEE